MSRLTVVSCPICEADVDVEIEPDYRGGQSCDWEPGWTHVTPTCPCRKRIEFGDFPKLEDLAEGDWDRLDDVTLELVQRDWSLEEYDEACAGRAR